MVNPSRVRSLSSAGGLVRGSERRGPAGEMPVAERCRWSGASGGGGIISVVRSPGRWAVAGLAAILAGGCGSTASRPAPTTAGRTAGVTPVAQVTQASCGGEGVAHGRRFTSPCVFMLVDGRRFRCPQRFARAVQTAGSLERARACVAIAPVHLGAAVRRVTATIEAAQACLTAHKVRAIGGPVLPVGVPDLHALAASQNGPDGELIAGYLPNGALLAFYRDVAKAARLEPAILNNARRIHAQVQRRGATTIFWSRPPAAALRSAVQACVLG